MKGRRKAMKGGRKAGKASAELAGFLRAQFGFEDLA